MKDGFAVLGAEGMLRSGRPLLLDVCARRGDQQVAGFEAEDGELARGGGGVSFFRRQVA
jgi:hypothetical protein